MAEWTEEVSTNRHFKFIYRPKRTLRNNIMLSVKLVFLILFDVKTTMLYSIIIIAKHRTRTISDELKKMLYFVFYNHRRASELTTRGLL